MKTATTGQCVGAHRWPYEAAHPNAWRPPWRGTVLATDDPRIWAKPEGALQQQMTLEEIAAKVRTLRDSGLLQDWVPVQWDFGTHKQILWEHLSALRSYEEDMEAWSAARQCALTDCRLTR